MIKNRGMSSVVATVSLLLVTVVAVTLLAQFVIPFVRDNLAESSECLNYREYLQFEESFSDDNGEYYYNCYQIPIGGITNNYHGFSVRVKEKLNGTSDNIAGFKVVFVKEGGNTESVEIKPGSTNKGAAGNAWILGSTDNKLFLPANGGVKTYVYNPTGVSGTEHYREMEIYPVLKNGRICDVNDKIKLVSCEDGLSGKTLNN
jgi:FlaG/FlaF family flagellin (archaellin)